MVHSLGAAVSIHTLQKPGRLGAPRLGAAASTRGLGGCCAAGAPGTQRKLGHPARAEKL